MVAALWTSSVVFNFLLPLEDGTRCDIERAAVISLPLGTSLVGTVLVYSFQICSNKATVAGANPE